ncbi:MAG TPA: lysylphosphatidylglycerol synthase domain-containing protein [Dongiaceae bacterium]|nr:lysylphosphatidylglycerol synthase domain-containing protein [Dongiaceae bacterium]
MGHRRLRVFIGLLLGCALAVAVFATADFHSVLTAARLVDGGLAWVVLWRFVALALLALGWRQLFSGNRPPLPGVFLARWVGESVNTLLPVAQVGGEIARGRLVMRWPGGSGAVLPLMLVIATIIVDMTLNLTGQFALALAGAWQVWRVANRTVLELAVACLAALLPLALLALAQQPAVLARAHRGFGRLTGKGHDPASTANLSSAVRAVYGHSADLARALLLHLVSAFTRAIEVWIVLRLMGVPIGVMDAVMIEGLSGALRTAAFLLPAGLGVQEGALLVLCGWIGVPPATALALALVKRAREIVVGGAGLLVWLALERPMRRA